MDAGASAGPRSDICIVYPIRSFLFFSKGMSEV